LSVKIRLARHGAKKSPFYRVVVADERSRRNGRAIELVGRYDPRTTPSIVDLDVEKVDAWIAKGAQPTEAAAKLIAIARGEKAAPEKVVKPSKRAQAKAESEAEEAAAPQESAPAEDSVEETSGEATSGEATDHTEVEPAAVEDQPVVEQSADEAVDDKGAGGDTPAEETTG